MTMTYLQHGAWSWMLAGDVSAADAANAAEKFIAEGNRLGSDYQLSPQEADAVRKVAEFYADFFSRPEKQR